MGGNGREGGTFFTEFTEAVNDNTDGISKHRLSPYNAHYLNYTFTWFPVSNSLRDQQHQHCTLISHFSSKILN